MIGFFPDPYPDELLYSVCARFQERVQYSSSKSTIQELFGAVAEKVSVALPSHLGNLISSLPPGHRYTVDQLIDDHSLLPYCSPFLDPDLSTCLRQDMSGDTQQGVRRLSLFTPKSIRLPKWLRFCPLCAENDKKQFGECYWHRLHQLTGVEICPVHKVFLENSKVRAWEQRLGYELVCAEQAVTVQAPRPFDSSNFYHEAFLKIARDATWLLGQPSLVSRLKSTKTNCYRYLLERCGLLTYTGKVHISELSKAFKNYYPPDFLKLINCEFDEQNRCNWLDRLLRISYQWAHYSLHHLLLIHFLGCTVEEFFALTEKFSYFGYCPWPCLNKASHHFQRPQIEEYQITRSNTQKGKVTGKFSCACGFVYSRTGPDQSPSDRFRFDRVLSYGAVWETALRKLWSNSTLALEEVTYRLGVNREAVKLQAINLGLVFPRPDPTLRVTQVNEALLTNSRNSQSLEELNKLETYRREWLSIRKEYPDAGRSFLKDKFPRIHYWLYANDKEWLTVHLPPCQRRRRVSSIDWGSRDAQLAEAVRASALRLRNISRRPVRITKTEIANELGQLSLARNPLDELPMTVKAIAEVAEPLEEFAIRRIWWAADCYRQENIYPKRWQLKNRAGLSSKTAALPRVKSALDAASLSLDSLDTVCSAKLVPSNEA